MSILKLIKISFEWSPPGTDRSRHPIESKGDEGNDLRVSLLPVHHFSHIESLNVIVLLPHMEVERFGFGWQMLRNLHGKSAGARPPNARIESLKNERLFFVPVDSASFFSLFSSPIFCSNLPVERILLSEKPSVTSCRWNTRFAQSVGEDASEGSTRTIKEIILMSGWVRRFEFRRTILGQIEKGKQMAFLCTVIRHIVESEERIWDKGCSAWVLLHN